jgi:hypothetical protein
VNGNLDRRRFVRLAALSGAAALAGCGTAPSLGNRQPIRLGYVSPQSGALSAFGEADTFVIEGARGACKDGLEIGGRSHPVEILVLDSQSSPERAGVAARDLIDRVSRTPLVGGQWRKGTTWPFELAIVSNTIHPEIPATGTLQSIT